MAFASCGTSRMTREPPAAGAPRPAVAGPNDWRAAHRDRYTHAMQRARDWLDTLRVDPAELRSRGIKGKKKLVELLDAYYRLWKVATGEDRPALLARMRDVAGPTLEPSYHDMLTTSDAWFKQDATSYLRAALLMERAGLDTTLYRQEIKKAHDRLNAHMRRRGTHQRRVFHWYYKHFGLEEPFPLGSALREGGIIARRVDPAGISTREAYDLTHEVYAVFEYGDKPSATDFSPEEVQYLQRTLPGLTRRYLEKGNLDLAGELLECMHYLRLERDPIYAAAVVALVERQNADGSWGSYPRQLERLGDYVRPAYVLHTTLVVIAALTAVFDAPMP